MFEGGDYSRLDDDCFSLVFFPYSGAKALGLKIAITVFRDALDTEKGFKSFDPSPMPSDGLAT